VSPQTSGSDPLDALQEILRTTASRETSAQDGGFQLSGEDLVEDIDFGGLSLQAFADSEPAPRDGRTREISFADSRSHASEAEAHIAI